MLSAKNLLQRGNLALDWAAALVSEKHGFEGAGDVINAYYKSIAGFTAGGRLRDARVIANYVQRTFYDNGDYNVRPGGSAAPGLPNYRNTWLGRGLHMLGRYDLSAPTGRFVESQMHPELGGLAVTAHQPEAQREYDWGSTGAAILALLVMGRWEAAARGGEFLRGMLEEQPGDKGRFYLRRDADGRLLTDAARGALESSHCLDIGQTGQTYWYLGIAMNAFASLYLATGEGKWRDAGYQVLARFENCDQEVYATITNGKVAWGLAAMYNATRDTHFAKLALDVWAWHCEIQSPEGYWLRAGQYDSFEQQPLHITLDTTFERAFYMFELARTLDV